MVDKKILNLSNASFLVSVRLETNERLKNLKMTTQFYRDNLANCEFCFVEADSQPRMEENGLLSKNDKYFFWDYSSLFKRGECLNKASKLSTRDFYICIDTDVIVDPQALCESIEIINNYDIGIMYPYNGRFMYTTKQYKNFVLKHVINIKRLKADLNSRAKQVCVHPESLAGCFIIKKDVFEKINGFNPNFIGWGYENDELVERMHKLDYTIERIGYNESCLWHIFHECKDTSPKDKQPNIKENELLCKMVTDMSSSEVKDYIKTWHI